MNARPSTLARTTTHRFDSNDGTITIPTTHTIYLPGQLFSFHKTQNHTTSTHACSTDWGARTCTRYMAAHTLYTFFVLPAWKEGEKLSISIPSFLESCFPPFFLSFSLSLFPFFCRCTMERRRRLNLLDPSIHPASQPAGAAPFASGNINFLSGKIMT